MTARKTTSGKRTGSTVRRTGNGTGRSASPSSNNRPVRRAAAPAARRKTAAQQKRFRLSDPRKLMRLLPMIVIPVLLVALLVLVNKANKRGDTQQPTGLSTLFSPLQSTPAPGSAVVEGIDLKDMPREEATARVKAVATELLANIDMSVVEGDVSLRMTGSYIDATTDMEEILARVYDENATGSFTLTLTADADKVKERLASIEGELGTQPVEPYAEVRLNENNVQRFEIHEGQPGRVLDVEATATEILSRLAARDLQAQIPPVMKDEAPAMSSEYIKENTERIATYTTRFRDSQSVETIANRVFNINKAAEIINCVTVPPDEEWSFNDCVGKRTVDGGWKEANGISGGKEYTLQAGGGICQVSTTLYNALLRANIEVTDRKAHSIPSDYVDKGLDATVDSAGIDLKFKNDTGAPVYIFAYIRPDSDNSRYSTITVSLYGKPLPDNVRYEIRSEITDVNERTDTRFTYSDKIPEGYEMTTVTRHDGYTAEVYRDKYVDGELEDSTLLYTDKYRGNVAEITIGTGASTLPVPSGAEKGGSVSTEAG